jgi:hypothetical protein
MSQQYKGLRKNFHIFRYTKFYTYLCFHIK